MGMNGFLRCGMGISDRKTTEDNFMKGALNCL